jgi:hypothetical protein
MTKSKKPLAVLTADLHLGTRGPWPSRPEIAGDAEYSFTQIVDYAVSKEARCIVAAGDLFDSAQPDPKTMRFFARQMDVLQDAGVGFYFIQGNHEKRIPVAWADIHEWPVLLHGKLVDIDASGFRMYGINSVSSARLQEELRHVPRCELLVTHQLWEEVADLGAALCQGSLRDIPPKTELVLTGDVHIARDFRVDTTAGHRVRVLSPGSTSMRKIDEDPDKSFYSLTLSGMADGYKIESIPFRTRPVWTAAPLDTSSHLKDALDRVIDKRLVKVARQVKRLPLDLQVPLVHFTVCRELADQGAIEAIREKIGDRAHLFFRETKAVTEEIEVQAKRRREIRAGGLVGCLELVVEDTESALYQDTKALLEAGDPVVALAELRSQYLEA